MLWTAGVHIHDPWTQLFCLYNLFKTKKAPMVFTTLYPHPISSSLFDSPNGYQKLGSDNHASIMDGASVYHDPLPYPWFCSVPSKKKNVLVNGSPLDHHIVAASLSTATNGRVGPQVKANTSVLYGDTLYFGPLPQIRWWSIPS